MNANDLKPLQPPPFDIWAVLDFWWRRWRWVSGWTLVLACAGACGARLMWRRSFTSDAQLLHYEPSAIDDTYHPRELATPSLVVMLQSPGLLAEVGSQLHPPLSATELAKRLQITLDRNNDVVTVTATGASRDGTVQLVNRFCTAAVAYTQTMQRGEAAEAGAKVNRQLGQVETDIAAARAATPPAAIASVQENAALPVDDLPRRILAARDQLADLLGRYTEFHPLVREQEARLAALEQAERQSVALHAGDPPLTVRASAPAAPTPAFYGRITPEEVAMGERFRNLETSRALLIGRQRAIQPFSRNPPGYFIFSPYVTAKSTVQHNHRLEIVLYACLGAFCGLIGSAGQILLGEFFDNRIKTRADVRRVTGLPLLAALGDVKRMPPADRDQWAFRAWTALQSHLSISPNHGMVCGITSAHRGDGRSTWINLLAGAANDCGFRVLTIRAQPSLEIAAELERRDRSSTPKAAESPSDILSAPDQISEQLANVDGPARLDIPLPGWVWNLERRKQWKSALKAWRTVEHVVIFVELPPACVPETVLLAENVPNLIWLADSNRSDAAETHRDLETLRGARCNLVGAVLNRESAAPVRDRFSRWLPSSAVALLAGLAWAAPKASGAVAPAEFSIAGPAQRSEWQQRLTLGPGDVLTFRYFDAPELTREEVPLGPDGRVSYLEAENILAAGLTVDEFRERLNDELGKYRRAPQAFVTPVAYRSKKYYLLGAVVQNGIFPLDRPITVIEAVARAGGFETGVSSGDRVETADFSRSFIARGGKRVAVDFERLFERGDLSQNIPLEPNDYLCFPSAPSGDIDVLGEVRTPGPVPWDSDQSVISAIAAGGGFTERAWKKRALVVRGSLDHPETFVVDVAGALDGLAPNLALQPGDIVYVSSRPWIRGEELLDRAASAFVESAVVIWTGINVGPNIISRPKISP